MDPRIVGAGAAVLPFLEGVPVVGACAVNPICVGGVLVIGTAYILIPADTSRAITRGLTQAAGTAYEDASEFLQTALAHISHPDLERLKAPFVTPIAQPLPEPRTQDSTRAEVERLRTTAGTTVISDRDRISASTGNQILAGIPALDLRRPLQINIVEDKSEGDNVEIKVEHADGTQEQVVGGYQTLKDGTRVVSVVTSGAGEHVEEILTWLINERFAGKPVDTIRIVIHENNQAPVYTEISRGLIQAAQRHAGNQNAMHEAMGDVLRGAELSKIANRLGYPGVSLELSPPSAENRAAGVTNIALRYYWPRGSTH